MYISIGQTLNPFQLESWYQLVGIGIKRWIFLLIFFVLLSLYFFIKQIQSTQFVPVSLYHKMPFTINQHLRFKQTFEDNFNYKKINKHVNLPSKIKWYLIIYFIILMKYTFECIERTKMLKVSLVLFCLEAICFNLYLFLLFCISLNIKCHFQNESLHFICLQCCVTLGHIWC